MPAIPDCSYPGQSQLRDRAIAALDRGMEDRRTEFKSAEEWPVLKKHIVRTAMAMANLRDGGDIIVGVSGESDGWKITGITDEVLQTFDPDDVLDAVNRHASPPVSLEIVLVHHREVKFLVIAVQEFSQLPIICQRAGDGLVAGSVYIRPAKKPETRRVENAEEMRELLDLAIEKGIQRFHRTVTRLGYEPPEGHLERFDDELEGL